jgi:hypothetical protein
MARQPLSLTFGDLTPDRWVDLLTLFGPRGACAGCWCQYWHTARGAYEAGKTGANKLAFKRQVEAGPPPGILASSGLRKVARVHCVRAWSQ